MSDFLLAYILTNLIELIPFNFLIKKPFQKKILFLILINSITLPLFWFLFPFFFDYFLLAFMFFELLIVIFESFLIKFLLNQSLKSSFIISFSMNFFSAVIGFLFF